MTTGARGWMEEPLRRFVRDAGVSLALVAHPSGRVLGQVGFARAVDVMSACALAAAANATATELGRLVDGKPFNGLHQSNVTRQAYLVASDTRDGAYLLLAVFDDTSSLGLVRMYVDLLREELSALAPARPEVPRAVPAMEDFERDLHHSLALVFGRAS